MLAAGFSLTEMMIALGAGAALVCASAKLTGDYIIRSTLLDREQVVTDEGMLLQARIEQQLQRAGYMGAPISDRARGLENPFTAAWQVGAFPGELQQSCVLFSYDLNHNGVIDEDIPNERFGLRLRDGALEARVDGRNCSQSGWQDLTSPDILVTVFTLDTPFTTPALVHIQFTLRHRRHNTLTTSRHFAVRLPNFAS